MTYYLWQLQGSLSSPGTLRKETVTMVMSLPTLTAYGRCETRMGGLVAFCFQRTVENFNAKGKTGISILSSG